MVVARTHVGTKAEDAGRSDIGQSDGTHDSGADTEGRRLQGSGDDGCVPACNCAPLESIRPTTTSWACSRSSGTITASPYLSAAGQSNRAESFISRVRKAAMGTHHCMSGEYLDRYVGYLAWREDMRRHPLDWLFRAVLAKALAHPVSRNMKGYW